jgi:hypothetical protein
VNRTLWRAPGFSIREVIAVRVVISQVDMDTALAAWLLGVSTKYEIIVVPREACPADLLDPSTFCIEAGGSGQTHLGNFDHHNTELPLPPACRQVFELMGNASPAVDRLVHYVECIDTGLRERTSAPAAFPTLSALFSGMRLSVSDAAGQLFAGFDIYRVVLEEGLDPFGVMPHRKEWRVWIERKCQERESLAREVSKSSIFISKEGRRIGFLETSVIGGPGALYRLGCDVGITYSPRFGTPPVAKYTIGSNVIRVDMLLAHLNQMEEGWGGPSHGTIIASPRSGSKLTSSEVIAIVSEHL